MQAEGYGARWRTVVNRYVGRVGLYGLVLLLTAGCCCFGGRKQAPAEPRPQLEALGGASVHVTPIPSAIHSVAVMPFQAPTELIGRSTSDLFVTELLRSGRYELVERSQLAQVLNEAEVALSGISDSRAVELGNMIGADGVIIGTVDEYGTVAFKGKSKAVVGLSVRLIDCVSGRVMWSASYSATAKDETDPLSLHTRKVVRGTVIALANKWKRQRQIPRQTEAVRTPQDQRVGRSQPVARTASPPVEQPPAAPASLQAGDFGLRAVKLEWANPSNADVRYRIERADDPDGPFIGISTLPASRLTYTDHGDRRSPLEDGAMYYYRAVAVAPSGLESEPGPVVESMTAPPPRPPQDIEARAPAGRKVVLTWSPSPSDGVVRYVVERAGPDGTSFERCAEVIATRFEEGGTPASPLADETAYRYRVQAVNRVGAAGDPSPPVTITTRPPPARVEGITAIDYRPRAVPLMWEVAGEEDVTGYEISRAQDDESIVIIAEVDGRSTTVFKDTGQQEVVRRNTATAGLANGTTYTYRVRAINRAGARSSWSRPVQATTKPAPVQPQAPSASQGEAGRIRVSWPANPEPDIAEYIITASAQPDQPFREVGRVNVAPDADTYLFMETPLRPDMTRYYRVRAIDVDGLDSAWSEGAHGTTKPAPDAPQQLEWSWQDNDVIVTWEPPPQPDISHYRLWQKRFLLGRKELAVVDEPRALLSADTVGRRLELRITAIDQDGLESAASESINVRPP